MDLKRIGKALLFPHLAIMIILVPVSAVFLICSMAFIGTQSPIAIASYVLAAYTLTVWCMRIPDLIRFFKSFQNKNKYAQRWFSDTQLRISVSLYGTLVWNTAYALFQLWLGIFHRSFWFCSLACYYITLAVMRFFLARYTSKHKPCEQMQAELLRYRACGVALLIMNLALTAIIFFMVYWNRTFNHHEITTIAMAAYTFTSLTRAITNIIKYRKLGSPVYSASKAVGLASACVSVLTLESTMLTTFGSDTMTLATRRIMLGASGGVISAFIIAMAIYMIVRGTKNLTLLKAAKEQTNG